jgi:hypothetical protein
MRFPTAGEIARNATADAAKIGMDNRFWEPFVAFLTNNGLIPKTTAGRVAFISATSALGAAVQTNVGEGTLVSKVINEVASDVASEVGGRILRLPAGHQPAHVVATAPHLSLPSGSATLHRTGAAIRSGVETLTARLNRWAGR